MDALECTKILKALGEDTRMKIFEMLRGGKKCGCQILESLNITQPTLSHHMKIQMCIRDRSWRVRAVARAAAVSPFTRARNPPRNAEKTCGSWIEKTPCVSLTKILPSSSATKTICKNPFRTARTSYCIPITKRG